MTMTEPKKRSQPSVSDPEFVRAWESSDSLPEVTKKTGIAEGHCALRASNLRKKGVNLRYFKPGRKKEIDVDTLNRIIEEMGGGMSEEEKKARQAGREKSVEDLTREASTRKERNLQLLTKLLKSQ